jgi:hypothetical protein
VRSIAGNEDFLTFLWLPDSVSHCDFQPFIQDNPELTPMLVELERKNPSWVKGDDFDVSRKLIGERAKFSPRPDIFFYFFSEIFNIAYFLCFSCRTRGFCSSCHSKRLEEWGEWMREELVLLLLIQSS